MRYAVIMAGGSGKRLWPMSRKSYPKQLLSLVGNKSLLELSVERLEGLFDPAGIYIITSEQHADSIRRKLALIPASNIIGEPEGKDTCNAIALMAEILGGRNEEGTMSVFTADHVIRPADRFRETVALAMDVVEKNPESLLTFGITPLWPHTGLGYIQRGEKIANGIFEVRCFHEKPDRVTAEKFFDSGEYFWNSGMFAWTLNAIRKALREFVPAAADALSPISGKAAAGEDYMPVVRKVYPELEKNSIDYAVMEKSDKVITIEMECEWIDVGSWTALKEVIEPDENDNVVIAGKSEIVYGGRNVVVSNQDDHLVAVAGVDDCVVVHTGDATLVCSSEAAQNLKDMVDLVDRKFNGEYT